MDNIKKRMHRHMFWIGLVSLVLMLVDILLQLIFI